MQWIISITYSTRDILQSPFLGRQKKNFHGLRLDWLIATSGIRGPFCRSIKFCVETTPLWVSHIRNSVATLSYPTTYIIVRINFPPTIPYPYWSGHHQNIVACDKRNCIIEWSDSGWFLELLETPPLCFWLHSFLVHRPPVETAIMREDIYISWSSGQLWISSIQNYLDCAKFVKYDLVDLENYSEQCMMANFKPFTVLLWMALTNLVESRDWTQPLLPLSCQEIYSTLLLEL